MINSLEAYASAGQRAAIAMNQRDTARHNFHSSWARRAFGLETEGADRTAARAAYDLAYREHRNVPHVEYFK